MYRVDVGNMLSVYGYSPMAVLGAQILSDNAEKHGCDGFTLQELRDYCFNELNYAEIQYALDHYLILFCDEDDEEKALYNYDRDYATDNNYYALLTEKTAHSVFGYLKAYRKDYPEMKETKNSFLVTLFCTLVKQNNYFRQVRNESFIFSCKYLCSLCNMKYNRDSKRELTRGLLLLKGVGLISYCPYHDAQFPSAILFELYDIL